MEQMGAFLPLILIFVVFYVLLIRPQQKKVKQHREMISNLKRGNKIITINNKADKPLFKSEIFILMIYCIFLPISSNRKKLINTL